MNDVVRMAEENNCRHGFDKRMVHCAECADPAFHAAKGPPMGMINAMATLHAPAATALAMDYKVRTEIASQLRERAKWLRREIEHGGNWEHLSARETECLWLAEKIEKGLPI